MDSPEIKNAIAWLQDRSESQVDYTTRTIAIRAFNYASIMLAGTTTTADEIINLAIEILKEELHGT